MRADEVKACALCKRGVCAGGHLTFHRIRFERLGVDRKAINERIGLHHLFQGNASPEIIEAFAPTPDVAILVHEPASILVCEECANERAECLILLAELANDELEAGKPPTPMHRPPAKEPLD